MIHQKKDKTQTDLSKRQDQIDWKKQELTKKNYDLTERIMVPQKNNQTQTDWLEQSIGTDTRHKQWPTRKSPTKK